MDPPKKWGVTQFDGFSTLALTFDHAYSSKYPFIDSLIVKISADCGETWERLLATAYEELETAPASTTSFYP